MQSATDRSRPPRVRVGDGFEDSSAVAAELAGHAFDPWWQNVLHGDSSPQQTEWSWLPRSHRSDQPCHRATAVESSHRGRQVDAFVEQ
jgi:hypothetical protein